MSLKLVVCLAMPTSEGIENESVAVKTACLTFKLKLLISIIATVVVVSIIIGVAVSVAKGKDSAIILKRNESTTNNVQTTLELTTLGNVLNTSRQTTTGDVFASSSTVAENTQSASTEQSTTSEITATTDTPPSCSEGFTRTVIFIQSDSTTDKQLFIRGGLDPSRVGELLGRCPSNVDAFNPCAVRMTHYRQGTTSNYDAYNAWAKGDNYLDWYGSESGQGSYHGVNSNGTPSVITTNVSSLNYWHPLNTFGANYWLADVCMNCSQTTNGWFEMKSVISDAWENNVAQPSICGGSTPQADRSRPFSSENHIARCGKMNVFKRNDPSCIINNIDGFLESTYVVPTTTPSQSTTTVTTTTPNQFTTAETTPSNQFTTAETTTPSNQFITAETTPSNQSTTIDTTTTTAPHIRCPVGMNRTVILIKSSTNYGETLFLRGGNAENRVTGFCQSNISAVYNPCAVKIKHGDSPINSSYAAWAVGDEYMDWYGPEQGQGRYGNKNAEGSPMMWTTNDMNKPSWTPLNTFGANYWLADMCMNCTQTVNGWFEFKSIITGMRWESDVTQYDTCSGFAVESERRASFKSGNHIGYCGRLNVVIRNSGGCTINDL